MVIYGYLVYGHPESNRIFSHEKIMINLDGFDPQMDHGAKILGRFFSISGAINRHWCHLCHVCLYAKIVHHREWLPTIALYLRCSCLGLECQRVLAEQIEVLLTLPERKKLSGKMENFLSGLTHWNGPPLQTSWLTGQTEALPRIIFDTAETKEGSAWHLHPVVIQHRTYGKYPLVI